MEYVQLPDYQTGAGELDTFLHNFADATIDTGNVAVAGMQGQLWRPRQNEGDSRDFVEEDGNDLGNGLVELYGPRYALHLDTIGSVMAGAYAVVSLTPDISMPAIIAVDQDKQTPDQVKLWLWRQPWRSSGLTTDQAEILAAAAQLEAPGVGSHRGNSRQIAGEAQHLLTLLGISGNNRALQAWSQGQHTNHAAAFRAKGTLPSVSNTLLSDKHQVSSLHIRENGRNLPEISLDGRPYQLATDLRLLWHRDSMASSSEQGVRIGDSNRALTIVQGAGFMAVRHNIDNVKRAIDGN
ncbi:MAG: hypothetical protein ACQR33_01400 [Candidatus Saccharibacteria bacterium]